MHFMIGVLPRTTFLALLPLTWQTRLRGCAASPSPATESLTIGLVFMSVAAVQYRV